MSQFWRPWGAEVGLGAQEASLPSLPEVQEPEGNRLQSEAIQVELLGNPWARLRWGCTERRSSVFRITENDPVLQKKFLTLL